MIADESQKAMSCCVTVPAPMRVDGLMVDHGRPSVHDFFSVLNQWKLPQIIKLMTDMQVRWSMARIKQIYILVHMDVHGRPWTAVKTEPKVSVLNSTPLVINAIECPGHKVFENKDTITLYGRNRN